MADSTSSSFAKLPLRCRCTQLKVTLEVPKSSLPLPLSICHCDSCRAATGQLCATVVGLPQGSKPPIITGLAKGYKSSDALERFFCETCGSSVYEDASGTVPGLILFESGAIDVGEVDGMPIFEPNQHIFVADTKDGGLRDWMPHLKAWEEWMDSSKEIASGTYFGSSHIVVEDKPTSQLVSSKDELQCSCKCGGVQFSITRPKHGSAHWPEPSESEMSSSPTAMPKSPEVFMPVEGARYSAFLCACNDCRYSSGPEVSAWAIIPKKNFRAADRVEVSSENLSRLQAQSTMKDYESSPGVHRQFCGGCGATLSFSNEDMPNVMNVSVGLMKGKAGSRVEDWLSWQTSEIRYAGLAQNKSLVNALSKGMREWQEKQDRDNEKII